MKLWNNCKNFFFFKSYTFIPIHTKKKKKPCAGVNINKEIQHLHYLYSCINQCFIAATRDIVCTFFPLNWEMQFCILCIFKMQLSFPLPQATITRKSCFTSYWNIHRAVWVFQLWSRGGAWKNYSLYGMLKKISWAQNVLQLFICSSL